MLPLAAPGALPLPWTRAAIHDTVAAIVRQTPYRRDLQRTLFDRVLRWIVDVLDRMVAGVRGVPHGREIAVVAATLLLILIVARVIYARRLGSYDADEGSGSEVLGRSFSDPLHEAEQLASAGQYTEAAHALYRAVIGALAARGLVRLHSSKTSGDYARELRRKGAGVEMPFRRFGSRYDRIIYGTGACDAAHYASLLDDARVVFIVGDRERAA